MGGGPIPVVQGVVVGSTPSSGGGYHSQQQQQQQQQPQQYSQQQQSVPQYSASPYGGTTTHQGYGQSSSSATAGASAGAGNSGDYVNFSNAFGITTAGVPDGNFDGVKGEAQPNKFRDVFWAIAFLGHLAVMLVVMTAYSMSSINNNNNANGGNVTYDYTSIVWVVVICALVGGVLSSFTLRFMMAYPMILVKVALIFSVVCSLLVALMGLLTGNMWMAILGSIGFLLNCCYAYMVWGRIPFAAANLKTALAAVRANMGLSFVAHLFLLLAFGWSLWWSVTAGAAISSAGTGIVFLFLLSYYWTHQVIQNTVHVTTAGVVGTWWFAPHEASAFWSEAIQHSLTRASTYSFGSICFGSFLVALVQALRALHRMARENDDCSVVICLIDCILGCIEGILEYINKWAYVYVGLYGYSYLEAGRNVITLFQNKGWTTIITDDLVENVLFMMSVAIGFVTGLIGLIYSMANPYMFQGLGVENTGMVGFL